MSSFGENFIPKGVCAQVLELDSNDFLQKVNNN